MIKKLINSFLKKRNRAFSTNFRKSTLKVDFLYSRLPTPGVTSKEIRESLKQRFDLDIEEYPLRVSFKGRDLKLQGDVVTVTLVDERIFILIDRTLNQNVHAFDLLGNHLWDIEEAFDSEGKPEWSFGEVSNVVKDNTTDKDLLLLFFNPYTWATDLETGRGTKLVGIRDQQDDR
jgi:hypothetical protein